MASMEALVVQLSNTFQHKCRLYLHECLEEFSHRYAAFQRETLEDVLRDCISAAQRLDLDSDRHDVDTDLGLKADLCVLAPREAALGRARAHADALLPKVEARGGRGGRGPPPEPEEEEEEEEAATLAPEEAAALAARHKAAKRLRLHRHRSRKRARKAAALAARRGRRAGAEDEARAADSPPRALGCADLVKADCEVEEEAGARRKVRLKARQRPRSRPGRPGARVSRKVDEEVVDALGSIIGRDPSLSYDEINRQLRLRLPHKAHISRAYLAHTCRGLFYTLDKGELASELAGGNGGVVALNVSRYRHIFIHWFMTVAVNLARVVYVDEIHFNVFVLRRGHQAPVLDSMALLLAVSPQAGREHHLVSCGATPGDAFQAFMRHLDDAVGPDGEPCAFIFDHSLRDRMEMVQLGNSPNRCVQMLPPCSPSYSPMHAAVGAWKAAMRRRVAGVQSLLNDVSAACSGLMFGTSKRCATARELRASILREQAEAALECITREKVQQWQETCRRRFLNHLVDG